MCVSEVKVNSLSHVRLFVATWTAALQAPLSTGFSRQEYWRGLPCSPPRDLPDPGIKPESLASCALAGRFFPTRATWGFQYQAKILWHLYHVPVCGFSPDPDIKLIYLLGGASKLCNVGGFLRSNLTRIFKAEPGLPSMGLEPRPSRSKSST